MPAFQWDEIQTHNTEADAWIVVHGNVYNVSIFLEDHPGGKDIILEAAGQDATTVFEEAAHSSEARDILPSLLVGSLKGYRHAVQSFDALHDTGKATAATSAKPGAESSWASVVTPALVSALAVVWWYGWDRGSGESIRQKAYAVGTEAPWWLPIAVIICLGCLGVFSAFFSHIVYVDFGRLEKYPSRVRID